MMAQRPDEDGRMIERIDERTQDHGRRISALEAKVWAAVAAGFTAFIGALFNLLGMGR